jgi:SAM-dependent methyltransferase
MAARPEIYLHGHHESVLRSHRWRTVENSASYLVDRLEPGARVLDVGCGPGTITIDIARRTAPGDVVGIDVAPEVIAVARAAATEAGVGNVRFDVGDLYALDARDASFDVVHAHQVLQHLADPVAALGELRRVCAPDGVVAARDADYAAMVWHPAFPELDRWLELYRTQARRNGGEPDAGRLLLAWAQASGFTTVTPSASVWCFASPADRTWWGGLWADRTVSSSFGEQLVAGGLADRRELETIAAAWRRWALAPDGWFVVVHGEVLATP